MQESTSFYKDVNDYVYAHLPQTDVGSQAPPMYYPRDPSI